MIFTTVNQEKSTEDKTPLIDESSMSELNSITSLPSNLTEIVYLTNTINDCFNDQMEPISLDKEIITTTNSDIPLIVISEESLPVNELLPNIDKQEIILAELNSDLVANKLLCANNS